MQTIFKRLNWSGSILLVFVVSACTTLEPISGEKIIRGIPADRAVVTVPTAVIGRTQDLRLDMAPAKCTPVASDDKGTYFQSDKQVIIRSWVVLNPRMVAGGVFVPNDPNQPCKPYYTYEGQPTRTQKAQNPVNVILVDTRTNRQIPLKIG